MALTRLYLRVTTLNGAGYVATTKSSALPSGTFHDLSSPVKWDLSTAKGTSQLTHISGSLLGQTEHQDVYLRKYLSGPLAVSAVDANTWTLALATREGNVNSNQFFVCSIYVLKADDTVRGYVYDSDTPLGVEYATAEDGQVFTVAGAAITGVEVTDRIVFEYWVHAAQAMASIYTTEMWADGTADVVDATTTNAASYIETPQDLLISEPGWRQYTKTSDSSVWWGKRVTESTEIMRADDTALTISANDYAFYPDPLPFEEEGFSADLITITQNTLFNNYTLL